MKDVAEISLRDFNKQLEVSLTSDGTFREVLTKNLNVFHAQGAGIRVIVADKNGRQLDSYAFGEVSDPFAYSERTEDAPTGSTVQVTIEGAFTQGAALRIGKEKVFRDLNEAIRLHWGHRDDLVYLPRKQGPGIEAKAFAHLKAVAQTAGAVGIVFLDLDDFGELNKGDKGGEPGLGDAVLSEFSNRVKMAFQDAGVILRSGGDEFTLIIDGKTPKELIKLVEGFRRTMQKTPFSAIVERENHTFGVTKTSSIGLYIPTDPTEFLKYPTFDEAVEPASLAQVRAKQEGKNRVRLVSIGLQKEALISANHIRQASLLARGNAHRDSAGMFATPFADALADILAEEFDGGALAEALKGMDGIYEAIGVQLVSSPTASAKQVVPEVTPIHWLAMNARAVLATAYKDNEGALGSWSIQFQVEEGAVSLVISSGSDVLGRAKIPGISCAEPGPISVGEAWYSTSMAGKRIGRFLPKEEASQGPGALSPVLLLPIGDAAIELASDFRCAAASIVEVDDRPVTGGGLPDFWQSNIVRVIRACLLNPNIESVLAVGNELHAESTISGLKPDAPIWNNLPGLAKRLGISHDDLQAFHGRDIKVTIVAAQQLSVQNAIISLINNIRRRDLAAGTAIDIAGLVARQRHLEFAQNESESLLLSQDGLRSRTFAEAYPRTIQKFRESNDNLYAEPSGRKLKEFTSFKISLSDALADQVPDYWKQDGQKMEKYFQDNFISPTGIFGQRLHCKIGNKSVLEASVGAAVAAIREKKPTRRLLIPLAHVPQQTEDVTHPVGLTAILISPRLRGGKQVIDFTWIWRTVEVLVGLPFSAYGSLKLSEYYLKLAKEEAQSKGDEVPVMGQLEYIALSLHMFQDIGDLEIARAIVFDAAG